MGHPAHYHNISVVIRQLSAKGHEIHLVARSKDVLFNLIEGLPYSISRLNPRWGNGKISLIVEVLKREIKMLSIVRQFKPDAMVGTDIVITHIGKLLGIPSVIINEDDVDEIKFFTDYGIKYCDVVLSPTSCDCGAYQYKTINYDGYHELAYLHPDHFQPEKKRAKHLLHEQGRYFIMRFSGLDAHHDIGKSGIPKRLAFQIIEMLKEHGRVYITSERPLDSDFEPYRIEIDPRDIHHALYYADMYIGDSQTMTAEAAVLGTPAIRFNDFVGRLGYLEELEKSYDLTYGFKTDQEEALIEKIEELIRIKDLKSQWQQKRDQMIKQSINVANFWTWFFINYGTSKINMKDPTNIVAQYRSDIDSKP